MTPLGISILMNYCICGLEFERVDAPAAQELLEDFVERGLLTKRAPGAATPAYVATDGARVYLNALCAVPLPTQEWVIAPMKESK